MTTPVDFAGYLCPLRLDLDPMQRLFIYSFVGDAEFNGVELQYFDDPQKGRGWAVLMWRADGKIDFYIEPGVKLNRDYCGVAAGVGEWITAASDCRVEWTAHGVEADAALTLKDGRPLRLHVCEHQRRIRKALSFLAPMGESIRAPQYLPLFWMQDIDLVRVRHTEVSLTIGGQSYRPARIPVPVPHALGFAYFVRHCAKPFMVMFNLAAGDTLTPVQPATDGSAAMNGTVLRLSQAGQGWVLNHLSVNNGLQNCTLHLSPALPDVRRLTDGERFEGRFRVDINDARAVLAGRLSAERSGDRVTLNLQPTDPWTLKGTFLQRMTIRLFPSVFRTWPLTYRWTADITLRSGQADAGFQSHWERIDPKATS